MGDVEFSVHLNPSELSGEVVKSRRAYTNYIVLVTLFKEKKSVVYCGWGLNIII